MLKKSILLAAITLLAIPVGAQEFEKKLEPFRKITASPKINLILQKGDQESVRITYAHVAPEKINVRVSGNRLLIYLEDARIVEKQRRTEDDLYDNTEGIYKDAVVNAYVTYKELSKVAIRGEQELMCESEIDGKKFKLKAYGENELNFNSISAKTFKASLYGDNKLKVKGGKAGHQLYRVFGDNKVDTQALHSETALTRIYGDGRLSLRASDEVRITVFGDSRIDVSGTSHINKGLILGNANIRYRMN